MISRSTLIGALVVVELAIVGIAVRAIAGDSQPPAAGAFAFPGPISWHSVGRLTTPLDRTFPAALAPRVVVDVHDVDVVVQAGTAASIHVVETLATSGYVGGTIVPITAAATPDGVRIGSAGATNVHVMGHFTRQLKIVVPPAAQVEILSGARVDATGLRAKLVAHVEDGAIHVTDHRGDVDVSTGDGRIFLSDVQGADVAAATRDGRLYLTRVGADRIDAHTNFGRIYAVDLRAVDGALTTKEGRVAVSLAGNSDATVTANVGSGNEIRTPGIAVLEDGALKRTLRVGSGRGRFEVASDDGSITITQGASV